MIVWEPTWRTTGRPEPGDYIQAQCECYCQDKMEIYEGLFMFFDERNRGHSIPPVSSISERLNCNNIVIRKWRKGALPEHKNEKITEETEIFA